MSIIANIGTRAVYAPNVGVAVILCAEVIIIAIEGGITQLAFTIL